MFDKILVAIDFSEHSRRALDTALGMARPWGAEVILLHVCPLTAHVEHLDTSMIEVANAFERAIKAELHSSRLTLADWRERHSGQGVELSSVLAEGPPVKVILETIERVQADLVVMGTHGRTGLRHLLIGSVAERVVRGSPVPVLTVHAFDEAHQHRRSA